MNSSVAWLDASASDQRRMRELIQLFAQPESRDELGIGAIRDAFSNALFPGTSVLQTRARYHLFVPWAYQLAASKATSSTQLQQRARSAEQATVEVLRKQEPFGSGVIGARAGKALATLPSTIYWHGLTAYGILRRDTAPDQFQVGRRAQPADAEEFASRSVTDWHPTLPPIPAGFPTQIPDGFALTHAEATWLRERILDGARRTLLEHLVAHDSPPAPDADAPWLDPTVLAAAGDQAGLLDRARLFSMVINGASRLYNVMVAEAYERAGFNAAGTSPESHRDAFVAWVDQALDRHAVGAWDVDEFWSEVVARTERMSPRTERFVREWIGHVRGGSMADALDAGSAARQLVASRERTLKGRQSRLDNTKLLGLWGGQSGSAALTYRWTQVRRIVIDIHDGLGRSPDA